MIDGDIGKVNLTTKTHLEGMKRLAVLDQSFAYPTKYGSYKVTGGKDSTPSGLDSDTVSINPDTVSLNPDTWSLHPDWFYCTIDQEFRGASDDVTNVVKQYMTYEMKETFGEFSPSPEKYCDTKLMEMVTHDILLAQRLTWPSEE